MTNELTPPCGLCNGAFYTKSDISGVPLCGKCAKTCGVCYKVMTSAELDEHKTKCLPGVPDKDPLTEKSLAAERRR